MHDAALEWIAKHATSEPVSVLDIGGRDVNGSPRHLFPAATRYTVLDALPGEQVTDVDVIADAATWNPSGQQWDVIVCAEVLEHAAQWRAILRTAFAACAPGGRLIVTTAAPGRPPHSAVDGGERLLPGEHYANIRPAELERALIAAGWAGVVVDVQEFPADVRAVAAKPLEAR
jgi:SAM-dependent methyltransferase